MWILARWPYYAQESPWCKLGFLAYLAVGGLLFVIYIYIYKNKIHNFDIHLLCGGLSLVLVYCQVFSYLVIDVWDIWWLFGEWFSLVFISDVLICRFSRGSMLLVWMPPLTLAVINMRGLIFQPCALIASTIGLYLSPFVCMVRSRNLSCIKVKSMTWMIRFGVGISGPFCSYATPCM